MEISGFYGFVYKMSVWVMRLAYLNLLWISFTLLGLIIFGLGPSTSAMFSISRKWVSGEENVPVFHTFLFYFRTDFRKSLCLTTILAAIGFLLFADYRFFFKREELVFQMAKILIVNLVIVYLVCLIYIFPVFSHYDLKINQYVKQSFFIGIMHPIFTLYILSGMIGIGFVLLKIPGLILFFGGSSFSLWITWGAHRVFRKIESKKKSISCSFSRFLKK